MKKMLQYGWVWICLCFLIVSDAGSQGTVQKGVLDAVITPEVFSAETAGAVIDFSTTFAIDGSIRVFWPKAKPMELAPPQFVFLYIVQQKLTDKEYGKELVIPSIQGKSAIKTEEESGMTSAVTILEGWAIPVSFPPDNSSRIKIVFSLPLLREMRKNGIEAISVNIEMRSSAAQFELSKSKKITLAELFALLERGPAEDPAKKRKI